MSTESVAERAAVAGQMVDALRHRGPDDAGAFTEDDLTLVFRRLAILDVSPLGAQPMISANGRLVVVFNGEIYNFRDIRRELEGAGVQFRGRSDTEVLVEAIDRWGVSNAVEKANGMFAFAAWDRRERILTLGRDRIGEKPLYYGWAGETFLFASELKALHAHPSFTPEIDRTSLRDYIRYGYVPDGRSIYRGVFKIRPGSMLEVRPGDRPGDVREYRYWSATEVAERAAESPFGDAENDVLDRLDVLLADAVSLRMIADVPLGALLSGGVDSSLVVALMQRAATDRVRTFTIGFTEPAWSEAEAARAVAGHLGTDHTDMYVSPAEAMEAIPRLPDVYDEPFADSSQIPTLLVAELARRHVTVGLTGDGGDELFGGYARYQSHRGAAGALHRLPGGPRELVARGLAALPAEAIDRLSGRGSAAGRLGVSRPGSKLHRLATSLAGLDEAERFRLLASQWQNPADLVIGAEEEEPLDLPELPTEAERMMALDAASYLPGDLLVKVDRATMAHSLEARLPLLDPRVFEFGWRMPLEMKIRGRTGKWALRQVLNRYVPAELTDRPKMGFGVPVGAWLRGPLRPWAEELLSESDLRRDGFLKPEPIRQAWAQHIGGRDRSAALWTVLMFQAWLERWHANL